MSFREQSWDEMDRGVDTIVPNISRSGMLNLIRLKIWRKEPLSTVRLGDGEVFILRGNSPTIKRTVHHLWADEGMSEEKAFEEVRKILITGLQKADAIGLYYYPQISEDIQIYNNLDCQQAKKLTTKLMLGRERYSLPIGLLESLGIDSKEKIFFDAVLTHSFEFGYVESFRNLLRGTPVNLISPHEELFKKNRLEDLLQAPITYTRLDRVAGKFQDRPQVLERISNIQEPVVLFGYGSYGKDFGVFLREQGKVVLDVGRLLDAWAGIGRILTRPGELRRYTMVVKGVPQWDTKNPPG